MTHVFYSLFPSPDQAEAALLETKDAGISGKNCSFTVHRGKLSDELRLSETDAREGLFGGVLIGGVAGALLGGLMAGPLDLLQIGIAVSSLCGAGAGSIYGALGGALAGSGMPDRRLRKLADVLREGQVLITAEIDGMETEDRVQRIFRRHGAQEQSKAII